MKRMDLERIPHPDLAGDFFKSLIGSIGDQHGPQLQVEGGLDAFICGNAHGRISATHASRIAGAQMCYPDEA